MTGVALARELVLLGAESCFAEPRDAIPNPHAGFAGVHESRWAELGRRMRAWAELEGDDEPEGTDELEGAFELALRERLVAELDLGPAGVWLVLVAVAGELHPEVAAALALLGDSEQRLLASVAILARLLRASLGRAYADSVRELLGIGSPIELGIVEIVDAPEQPLTQRGLRLVPGELRTLLSQPGSLGADQRLGPILEPRARTPAYNPDLVAGVARLLGERALVALRCDRQRDGRQLALDVASHGGRDLQILELERTLPGLSELVRLRGGLPLLDVHRLDPAQTLAPSQLEQLAARLGGLLLLVDARRAVGKIATVDVPQLDVRACARAWREVLGEDRRALAEDLALRFRVGHAEARQAVREAEVACAIGGRADPLTGHELTRALREHGARHMGRLVTRLTTEARLEDLVVPDPVAATLRDVIGWYRSAPRVERDWSLPRTGDRGRGLSCLFSGSPGTGKTFAAQCLANELDLNLYRVDLSQVVSKWIGETEKSLSRIFDEAEAGHGILLFDEADVLFGRRTEIKDAHDRYANVEVGYLLQRMEAFSGLAILTTNLRGNVDPAFLRRLRFVLEFPLPDATQRETLWRRALPGEPHVGAIELEPLIARFKLSGGLIHNIGLAAAHLAAAEGEAVETSHLILATHRELGKVGMARAPSDFGPLAELAREAIARGRS